MPHHDIVIIGSGSGNSLVTRRLAERDVAIIEGGPHFGGTCLNVGCIPTKMFVLPADRADEAAHNDRLGIATTFDGADWPAIRDRIFGRIDPIAASGEEYRRDGERTTLYRGHARFVGERSLVVDLPEGPVEVTGDQVVVAAGAHAVLPPAIAASSVPVHTSDTIMRLPALPERLLIVGGGFIAAEMAHVFGSLGTRVTLAVRGDGMLRHHETEVHQAVDAAAADAWDLRTGVEVTGLEQGDAGVVASLSDGSTVTVDEVLVAVGRAPSTEGLGCDAAGIDLHPDGRVVVDGHGRTTADGVWALGDVCSPEQLKHVANQQARVVAHNLAHPDDLRSFRLDAVPSAVFTHPQVAAVGMTTAQAQEAGHDVVRYVQDYGATAYGWALEDETSRCVLVGDRRTGALLGAHLVGPQASVIIQPLIQAMSLGTPLTEVARGQYWIHPALTEVAENAILGLLEQMDPHVSESLPS
ncbi:mycothione reductase [Janibacter alkaliphilus]|uniref:Mycothione reductase n=1 Tax=Janibacter alkaliphilus TaxID=1069963 RepID=A0A852WXT7_9MICO|nr:mycothione reductase [Janibacter alkaliphilus]NYG35616.1 mycothione reductase [Janibacter alkaliphilus]